MGPGNEGTDTSICVMKIFYFVYVCSFLGAVLSAWAAIQNSTDWWFKPQTFIFAQLRKLKVHNLGACKLDFSGEDLSGLPEGPLFTGPSHGLPSKHQHLCYRFLSLKDINHVGLRFNS